MIERLFYPCGPLSNSHAGIIEKVLSSLKGGQYRGVNVVGDASVGKSSAVAHVAQQLVREGRRVAWWNCQSPVETGSLLRTAVAQFGDSDVVQELYEQYGRGLSQLLLAPREEQVAAVSRVIDQQGWLLFLDDCDQAMSDDTIRDFLTSFLSKVGDGRVVLVSREPVDRKIRVSHNALQLVGQGAEDWQLTNEQEIKELFPFLPKNVSDYLSDFPRYPRVLQQLNTALKWQSEGRLDGNMQIERDRVRSSPATFLDLFLYDSIVGRYGNLAKRLLLALVVLRGPRPLRMLWELATKIGLAAETTKELTSSLEAACLVSGQLASEDGGNAPLKALYWPQHLDRHTGMFHVPTAFSSLVLERVIEETDEIERAHQDAAEEYAAMLRSYDRSLFSEHVLEVGEAVRHFREADKCEVGWELLVELKETLGDACELPLLRNWIETVVGDLPDSAKLNAYFELCRLARKTTDGKALQEYIQKASSLILPTAKAPRARLNLYRSIDALYRSDMQRARRALREAAQLANEAKDGPLLVEIQLRRCRYALFMVELEDFLAMIRELIALARAESVTLRTKDWNFLFSCACEFNLLLGFPDRARAWATRAAGCAAGDAFREALSEYWLCRACCASVDLLQRVKRSRIASVNDLVSKCDDSEPHTREAVVHLLTQDVDTAIGQARQDAQSAHERMGRAFSHSGSIDRWWDTEFRAAKIDALRVAGDLNEARRVLGASLARPVGEECRRNSHGLRLLKLKLDLAGWQESSCKEPTRSDVRRQAIEELSGFVAELRSEVEGQTPFPHELAQARELLATFSPHHGDELAQALGFFLENGMFCDAGRCFETGRALPLPEDQFRGATSCFRGMLAPDNFRDPGYALPEEPFQCLSLLAFTELSSPDAGISRLRRPGFDLFLGRAFSERVQRRLRELARAAAERSRKASSGPRNIGESIHGEALFLRQVREICQSVLADTDDTLATCPFLRGRRRIRCRNWECTIQYKTNGSIGRTADGQSIDVTARSVNVSASGILLSFFLNGHEDALGKPGENVLLRVRLPGVAEELSLHAETVERNGGAKFQDKEPHTTADPLGPWLLAAKFSENEQQKLQGLLCFQKEDCDTGAPCYYGEAARAR